MHIQNNTSNEEQTSLVLRANISRLNAERMVEWESWRDETLGYVKKNPGRIFFRGRTDQKRVCLTFDDGPDLTNTPMVLNILKFYNIRGSFFIRGDKIMDLGYILKNADENGHLLLNHTWNHCDLKDLSRAEIRNEVNLLEEKIAGIIDKRPSFVRPPYGNLGENLMEELKDYQIILWSLDTFDWFNKDKDFIIDYVIHNIRPGDILLMHSCEGQEHLVAALPAIIEGLIKEGYQFIDLGEMLELNPYR